MALTISNASPQAEDVWGRQRVRVVTVTFDSSYATGGESFTPANVGLASFTYVQASVDASVATHGRFVVNFDYTNNKLMVLGVEQDADAAVTDPLDEENSAVDLSTMKVRVLCVGT